MYPIPVLRSNLNYYKTIFSSLTTIIILSWFLYTLLGVQYFSFSDEIYSLIDLLRPDFFIYFFAILLVTTFYNYVFQSNNEIIYWVKSYPVIYMMAPFFLDNYFFLLNKRCPAFTYIEPQFVVIDFPILWVYQILTIIYLAVGIIVMFFVRIPPIIRSKDKCHVAIACCFIWAEFNSSIPSAILQPHVAGSANLIGWQIYNYILEITHNLAQSNFFRDKAIDYIRRYHASIWRDFNFVFYIGLFVLVVVIIFIFLVKKVPWDKKFNNYIPNYKISYTIPLLSPIFPQPNPSSSQAKKVKIIIFTIIFAILTCIGVWFYYARFAFLPDWMGDSFRQLEQIFSIFKF